MRRQNKTLLISPEVQYNRIRDFIIIIISEESGVFPPESVGVLFHFNHLLIFTSGCLKSAAVVIL